RSGVSENRLHNPAKTTQLWRKPARPSGGYIGTTRGTGGRDGRMSGLLALLDDVAAIAKVAAASVDDVAGMAAKAGSKAAGVVIDDAAVTPKYVHGFEARRELPIIW